MLGPIMMTMAAAAWTSTLADRYWYYDPNEVIKRLDIHAYDRRNDEDEETIEIDKNGIICPGKENRPKLCKEDSYKNCIKRKGDSYFRKECPCGKYSNDKNSSCWLEEICYAGPGEFCSEAPDNETIKIWEVEFGRVVKYNDIRCPKILKCDNNVCSNPGLRREYCENIRREDNDIPSSQHRERRKFSEREVSSFVDLLDLRGLVFGKYNKYKFGRPHRQPPLTDLDYIVTS